MKLDHIDNLYKAEAQKILLFRECYALEKIHGTAASVSYDPLQDKVIFQSGGEKYNNFIALFDEEKLLEAFRNSSAPKDKRINIFGECYGASQQGMSNTYGKSLKFIAFDVQIGESWLDVPNGEKFANDFGLEYVPWAKTSTDLAALDAQRDAPSVQAIRNGVSILNADGTITNPRKREGVVLRPLVEVRTNSGDRLMAKHKGAEFQETKTPRTVVDPDKLKVLDDANAIAEEWMTAMRLEHVLDKIEGERDMKLIPKILPAVQEDVRREGKGEIVWSEAVAKAVGKKAVELYKKYLQAQIK